MMNAKGGMTRTQAWEAAMPLARQSARKLARLAPHAAEDILSAAHEGVALAWQSWDPQKGPWAPWAVRYLKEYASRETTRAASVVTTNYDDRAKRPVLGDVGVIRTDADGHETNLADRDVGGAGAFEARVELAEVADRAAKAIAAMSPLRAKVAQAVWQQRMLGDATHAEVADAAGVSRMTVIKVENQLRAALRAE